MSALRRIFFIVNPNSNGGRTQKKWKTYILPEILKIFPNIAWAFSQKRSEASLLANYAVRNHFDTVVAVGGDGTINEIVNGLLGNPLLLNTSFVPHIFSHGSFSPQSHLAEPVRPTLAVLSTGTGCDFIKTLNIPNDIPSALQIIKENKTILSDVGLIQYTNPQINKQLENRYFINIAGCGMNGEAVNRVNNSKKTLGSTFSFWLAILKTILRNKHDDVRISYDDETPIESDLSVLFICNGKYCGGGLPIAQNASLEDGFFHVRQINANGLLKGFFSVGRLYSGNYSGLNKYISTRTAKKVVISTIKNSQVLVECDGEQPGLLPTTFSIVPKALSICATP